MKKTKLLFLCALCVLMLLPLMRLNAKAQALDEILLYEVTVDVNEDATLSIEYHIDWKVLDSTSEGPLEWATIGIPSGNYLSMTPLSSAVREISYSSDGGSFARIDLDRSYYAGEVADIRFMLVQDYMYEVDRLTEGETVYCFTPGWFPDIQVDQLIVKWRSDKVKSLSSGSILESDGYYTWRTRLNPGNHLDISVTYPNDAYAFDTSKTIAVVERSGSGSDSSSAILGWVFIIIIVLIIIVRRRKKRYSGTAGFSGGTSGTKVTRTKVEYFPVCQGCGAPRPEGASNCQYCGRSYIKSEEVIEEKDLPPEEADLRGKKDDGLYRYSSQPNTYMRVHTVPIIIPRSTVTRSSAARSHSSSSRGSRGGGCAHSSCACACACACAGGGRAGCTAKDFYSTDLKLRQLELKKKSKSKN